MLTMIIFVSVAAGCANRNAPALSETPQKSQEAVSSLPLEAKKYKIALCVSHQQNEFILEFSNSVKNKAEELGVSLVLYDARQSVEKQVGQIQSIIAQGFDGILVEPVSVNGLNTAFESAKKANIPVVTSIQRVTNQEDVAAYVGTDSIEGGYFEMSACAQMLHGKGSIAILYGPVGSDSNIGREKGYQTILSKYPGMKVVVSQSAYWVRADAFAIMENWLQSGVAIDAVVAQNDDMALGALNAIENANKLYQIKVFGIDGTPDGLKNIKEGKMMATVSQNVELIGKQSMEALVKILNGERVEKENIVHHITITKDNIGDYIK